MMIKITLKVRLIKIRGEPVNLMLMSCRRFWR